MSGTNYQVHCYDGKTGFIGEQWFDHWPTPEELLPGTIRSDIALPVDAAGQPISRSAADACVQGLRNVIQANTAGASPDVCTSSAAQRVEPMTRFCPGCGSIGEVDRMYRDCCPDGSHARSIPESLAHRCHDLFYLALRGAVEAEAAPADQRFNWLEAERIGELPEVDEAIRSLLDDQTEDNATGVIRAVIDAAAGRLSSVNSQAVRDVLAERRRQVDVEGWTHEHDDEHRDGSMARAAASYALAGSSDGRVVGDELEPSITSRVWPWAPVWWKPKDRRHNLIRAGALIVAEIERLDRSAAQTRARGEP